MEKVKKVQAVFLYFFAYSVIGWLYEVFLEVVVYRWGFSNRGFLFGPYLPVYGFGALVIIFCLQPLCKKKIRLGKWNITPVLVFLGVMALTTLIELLASYLLEWKTGGWLWDYTDYAIQFQGRIALNPSVRFGLGGLFFLYVLQPVLEKGNEKLSDGVRNFFSVALFAVMLFDFIIQFQRG